MAFDITVNAVDDTWNLVTSANPRVTITSTDPAFTPPQDQNIAGGTLTFAVTSDSSGKWTITATDTADTTKTGTSSSVNVQ